MYNTMDIIKESDELLHYQTEYQRKKQVFIMQMRSQLIEQIEAAYKKQICALEVAENAILASIPVEVLQLKAADLRSSNYDIVGLIEKVITADGCNTSSNVTTSCNTKNKAKINSERRVKKPVVSSKKNLSPVPNRHMTPTKSSPAFESKAKSQGKFASKNKTGGKLWQP